MATYLIQNGVNKTSMSWENKQQAYGDGGGTGNYVQSNMTWNSSSKLDISAYIGTYAIYVSFTGWSATYNASAYAHLYVTCYTPTRNNSEVYVCNGSNAYNSGLSKTVPTSSGTLSFDLTSLSSSDRAKLQVYFRWTRSQSVNATLHGYISNMWLTRDYTITYNANGGSGAPSAQTFEEGTRIISSVVPTRSGYSFLGWSESSTATTATYDSGDSISLTKNTVLYAVWKSETTYTVTYYANGGSGTVPSTQSGTAGTVITVQSGSLSKSGYGFIGWATSSSSTYVDYVSGDQITLTKSLRLYAVWEKKSIPKNNKVKVYVNGSWIEADVFVYTGGAWKNAPASVLVGNTWKE